MSYDATVPIASGQGWHPPYFMTNGHFEGVDEVAVKELAAVVLGADIGAEEM